MKISSAAASLALAILGACRLFTGPEPQLIARISIDKPALSASEFASVTVVVINHGDKALLAADPRSYCQPAFRVLSATGWDLGFPEIACTMPAFSPVGIQPGDSIVIQRRWSPAAASGPLSPGDYQLVSRVFGDGKELGSAPVDFTVIASQASR